MDFDNILGSVATEPFHLLHISNEFCNRTVQVLLYKLNFKNLTF